MSRRRVRIDDDWRTLRTLDRRLEPRVSRNVEAEFAAAADDERRAKIAAERRAYEQRVAEILAGIESGLAELRGVLERRDRSDYRQLDNIRRALLHFRRGHTDNV